jgi:hypothetical protein
LGFPKLDFGAVRSECSISASCNIIGPFLDPVENS